VGTKYWVCMFRTPYFFEPVCTAHRVNLHAATMESMHRWNERRPASDIRAEREMEAGGNRERERERARVGTGGF
jgi:hypothetical protein